MIIISKFWLNQTKGALSGLRKFLANVYFTLKAFFVLKVER